MSSDVGAWTRSRMEGVPPEFRPWLEEAVAGGVPTGTAAEALERLGVEALRSAMTAPGPLRESAFRLLAADAHLTWACEALLERPDPESDLRDLFRRMVEVESDADGVEGA